MSTFYQPVCCLKISFLFYRASIFNLPFASASIMVFAFIANCWHFVAIYSVYLGPPLYCIITRPFLPEKASFKQHAACNKSNADCRSDPTISTA